MIITVTQDHINKGKRNSFCSCPIALALKGAAPGMVYVGTNVAMFGRSIKAILPEQAKSFIYSFDKYGVGYPFSFELNPEVPA